MNPNAIRVDRSKEDALFAELTGRIDGELVIAWGADEFVRQVAFHDPQDGGKYMMDRVRAHYEAKGWHVNRISITTFGDQARGQWRAIFMFTRPQAAPRT